MLNTHAVPEPDPPAGTVSYITLISYAEYEPLSESRSLSKCRYTGCVVVVMVIAAPRLGISVLVYTIVSPSLISPSAEFLMVKDATSTMFCDTVIVAC